MYFVVYLIEARRHAVIPCYWIYDTKDEMWDKFVNSGLNSSQKYLCYWKSENDSVEYIGAPNEFVEPNFNVPRSTQFPVDEATFYCQIIHFKVNFAMALNYCARRRRNVIPAVYNELRVRQFPIPIVVVERAVVEEGILDVDVNVTEEIAENVAVSREVEEIELNDAGMNFPAESEERDESAVDEEYIRLNFDGGAANFRTDLTDNVAIERVVEEIELNDAAINVMAESGEQPVIKYEFDIARKSLAAIAKLCATTHLNENELSEDSADYDSGENESQSATEGLDGTDNNIGENSCDGAKTTASNEPTCIVTDQIASNVNEIIDESGNEIIDESGNEIIDESGNESLDAQTDNNIGENSRDCTKTTAIDSGANNTADEPTRVVVGQIVSSVNEIIDGSGNNIATSSEKRFDAQNEIGAARAFTEKTEEVTDKEAIITFYDSDEEILLISFKGHSIPAPIQSKIDPSDFIKREKDRISGDKSFKEDAIGRKYIVGDEIITIPTQAINTFLMWSTEPYSERKSLDEKVLQMLLISCVPPPELALGRIKESTMMFIEDLFRIRVQGNPKRMHALKSYKTAYFKNNLP